MSIPESAPEAPRLVVRTEDSVVILAIPTEPAEFEGLRERLRTGIPFVREALGERAIRIDLLDRDIKLFDLRRILTLLKDEFHVEVTGLYARPEAVHRYAERELKLKLFLTTEVPEEHTEEFTSDMLEDADPAAELIADLHEAPVVEPTVAVTIEPKPAEAENAEPDATPAPVRVETPVADPGRRTLTVRKTLRSGSAISFEGDVILFGDVNPGAQIVASGNIVILGSLKGMAHAGATGDESCFILGFNVQPTQIRIGRRIAIPPERASDARPADTEIAQVVDGQIVIEPYRGKR